MVKLVVADDEERVCRLIVALGNWEELGIKVVGTAANGIQALELIRKEKTDILITDIRMPGLNGLELIEKVREISPDIKIMIISGYANFEYAQNALKQGVSDYLLKPINKDALNESLTKMVNQIETARRTDMAFQDIQNERREELIKLRNMLLHDLCHDRSLGLSEDILREKYYLNVQPGLYQVLAIKQDAEGNDSKEDTIELIWHKMEEILRISDEVTIMRDGKYIGTWPARELTTDAIITHMVGRKLDNLYPPRECCATDEVVFELQDFTSINPRSFRGAAFQLHKGEILGVGGLVGAQRTELMEGIFGIRAHSSGRMLYKGSEVTINRPRDAITKGIALLTEDRRASGILGVLSISDNVSVASLDQYLKYRVMLDDEKIEKLVQANVSRLSIKTPSSKTQIQSLSGGNQQKVLIARWLANDPDVLILDEPTRGIDVGAKYEIYCIIAELARQGKSIIMISSEMGELIGMSDRIMVMCNGRVTGFVEKQDATQEKIMALATQFSAMEEAI